METKISKIKFRQDTLENWQIANPILDAGEPGYVITTTQNYFVVGDGKTAFKDLPVQVLPENMKLINEPTANGKVYGRKLEAGQETGEWSLIPLRDKEVIYSSQYDIEIDLGYSFVDFEGNKKEVYAIRKHIDITAEALQESVKAVISNVSNLLQVYGSIRVDNEHYYPLPNLKTENYEVTVYLDKENNNVTLYSKSKDKRDSSPADIILIYTKQS